MSPYSGSSVRRLLDSWPGKKRFGVYRFLPLFFLLGAGLEFSMINWTVGETNFYRTFKRRQAKNYVEEQQNLQARTSNSTN
ncbi:small integral membrane protein 4 [Drosophila elegans]|uniref:small integral membrane protein 4 n=1 Tax=Drosophila elegans TaxID=30023 RepID=UPI0007E7BB23|nr:small integral membrane protein 4 [Drosophila elegans]XP_017114818.1 small integral membrane protein 4 [Drosophila elegans]